MTALTDALTRWTGNAEQKIADVARQARTAAEEIADIKATLARDAATESKGEREYRQAWLCWLATKDTRELGRVANEYKDVSTTSLPGGGYGMPKVTADAVGLVARTVNPWLDPAVLGIEAVAGRDYREPVNLADGAAASAAEGDLRIGTAAGGFIEVKPAWGEYFALMRASQWARADIVNFGAFIVREAGRQLGAKLAADIWNGNASGAVHGLVHTSPSATNDDGSNVSPNARRSQSALQYVATAGSPITSFGLADIENLLAEFREEYLLDPTFCFIMRNATWRRLVGVSSVAGAAFTMPREPTLFGFPVKFTAAMPAVAAGAYPVAAGAWKAAYALVATAETRVIVDDVTAPGFLNYQISRRVGGIVRDCNAAKLLKCGA